MIKRKIEKELLLWKNSNNKKPLIIKGLRQVGKTYIVKKFAVENYENVFFIDFRKYKEAHKYFENDFNISNITFLISANDEYKLKNDSKMIPYKTIIIFDELQDCPNARSSLKYFYEDKRFDVICTGSLLGIKGYHQDHIDYRGIGVGCEETIELKPLDFEEFYFAVDGNVEKYEYIKSCLNNHIKINDAIHESMLILYKKYLCIGGMPEVVLTFINTNDFYEVRKIQQMLIDAYKTDFGIHLNKQNKIVINELEKAKIQDIFKSIPSQLAKENNKFQYSIINKKADSRTYESAINWLEDYGLITRCYNVSTIDNPIDCFADAKKFKIYLNDTGLLISMLEKNTANELLNNDLGMGKGFIYENIIADTLVKNNNSLFYFSKDSGLEIDFIYKNNELYLLEVKSTSGRTKSSKMVLENPNYNVNKLIKISSQNIGINDNITTIPFYLAHLLLLKD